MPNTTSPMSAPSISTALKNEKAMMRKAHGQHGKHHKHSTVPPPSSHTRQVSSAPSPKCSVKPAKALLVQDIASAPAHAANVLVLLEEDDSQCFDSMRPSVGLSRMDSMRPMSVVTDMDIDDECYTPIASARADLSFAPSRTSSRLSRARFVGLCDEPSTMSRKGATSTCPESILTEMSNDFSRTPSLDNLQEKFHGRQRLGKKAAGMPFVLYSCNCENDGFVSSDDNDEVEDATSVTSHASPSGHRAVSWRRLDASCSAIEEDIDGVLC